MGNCFSIPCTCNCEVLECIKILELDKPIRFCLYHQPYIDEINSKMEELRSFKNCIKGNTNIEAPRIEDEVKFKSWMQEVEELDKKVSNLSVSLLEQSSCLCSCKLAMKADKILNCVQKLDEEKKSFVHFELNYYNQKPIVTFPNQDRILIGRNKTFSEILCYIKDVNIKIVGIFGMGGVGKTTILKRIKDEMEKNKRPEFESVIWITVSKDVDVTSIQNKIAKHFSIKLPSQGERGEEEQRVETLHKALMNKKLLLLIDDIWQGLDLESIGIPVIDCNMIKIAFTTRDKQVCVDMGSQKQVCVRSLNEEQSLELFEKNLGSTEILQDARFMNYARQIVKKCKGLPLAIITIGRAMTNLKNIDDWTSMIDMLNSYLQEIHGMESVMKILKVSFDKLANNRLRSSLLYCCLYPEDCNIKIKSLIERWVGEGLVESCSIGRDTINKLKSACLLEIGYSDEYVKMHDVVREMALWLTNDPNNYFKVYNTSPIARDLSCYNGWDMAKRISLMHFNLKGLPNFIVPKCPNLVTLLLNGNSSLHKFSMDNFFKFMPILSVLDLRRSALEEIPRSIKSLVNLQYLNLSYTNITCLPVEVGNLKKLRTLNLEATENLERIPYRVITELVNLRILCMAYSYYCWKSVEYEVNKRRSWFPCIERQLTFKDLENLKHLDDFEVDVQSESDFQTLVDNPILSKATRILELVDIDFNDADMKLTSSKFSKLQALDIEYCTNLRSIQFFQTEPLFLLKELQLIGLNILSINVKARDANHNCLLPNLCNVYIKYCSMLKDVTWTGKLPSLEELTLCGCDRMERVLVVDNDGKAQDERVEETSGCTEIEQERYHNSYFPKLRTLKLWWLQNLKSISKPTFQLLFPSLKRLWVKNCPKLENICLGPNSAEDMKDIIGKKEWWDGLMWEDEETKSKLFSYFQSF